MTTLSENNMIDKPTNIDYEDDEPIPMTDEEAYDMLEYFLDRSLSKGYMILPDFEDLMQSIHIAITWYYQLKENNSGRTD